MSRSSDEFVVLHVDDDPQLLALSEQLLPQADDRLVVETVSDPTAAVERIRAATFDAVVSDYRMPELTGIELLQRVRALKGQEFPFVLFTGEDRESVASEALNHKVDRYLKKGGEPGVQYRELAATVVDTIEAADARPVGLHEASREIYENVPLAVVVWSPTGRIVDWNDRAEALFGWSATEARGAMLDELVLPSATTDPFETLAGPLLTDGESTERVVETVTKDGQSTVCRWYNTSLRTVDGDSEIEEVVSMVLDTTRSRERKAKLQEYATAVEASDDSIYMLDPDGEYVFANREHLTRLAADGKISRAAEEAVVGRKYASIHPKPEAARITNILQEVCTSGEPKTEEYAFETEDTWSYRTYSPVSDPDTGDQLGVVVISKDITRRKRMEERESFLSSLLRHDVKNKIHTADGYLDLIDDGDCSPEAREHLETAMRALSGSLELIEQISTLSQLAHEDVGVRDLKGVLDDVVAGHASQAAAEGVDLSYEGCEGSVRGGPLLEALFENLLTNALKHSNAETIEITCGREDDEYVVVVADDGCGLPTETAAQLLEEGVSKGESAGTGLGLYLVDRIAESYGGHVELGDADSGGLRVSVYLQAV